MHLEGGGGVQVYTSIGITCKKGEGWVNVVPPKFVINFEVVYRLIPTCQFSVGRQQLSVVSYGRLDCGEISNMFNMGGWQITMKSVLESADLAPLC